MREKRLRTGVETSFKDKDGKPIKVHDYVKDSDGNRYYINSYCQAVPEGSDAPAVELSRLMETTLVSVMSIEEVLNMPSTVEHRRRGGRRKTVKTDEEAERAAAADAEAKAVAEARLKAAEEAARQRLAAQGGPAAPSEGELHPVTQQLLLSVIPDDVLAGELRRRGYTLCAVRPALVEL